MQSSRSKLTTCPRDWHLLRFKLSSTATSDGCAQKLENNVWHDSESITTKVCSKVGRKWNATCLRKRRLLRFESNSTATSDCCLQKLLNEAWRDSALITTKVCSQISRKWNAMFECSDQRWKDELQFLIWRFFELSDLVNNDLLCYQPSITQSRRSVPNFKLSVLTFSKLMSCLMSIEQKLPVLVGESSPAPEFSTSKWKYSATAAKMGISHWALWALAGLGTCTKKQQGPKQFWVLLDLKLPRNRRERSIDSMAVIDVHVGGFPG